MSPAVDANPKIANYNVLWGEQETWAQLANDKKTFECQISFRREALTSTAPLDQYTIIENKKATTKISYFI